MYPEMFCSEEIDSVKFKVIVYIIQKQLPRLQGLVYHEYVIISLLKEGRDLILEDFSSILKCITPNSHQICPLCLKISKILRFFGNPQLESYILKC